MYVFVDTNITVMGREGELLEGMFLLAQEWVSAYFGCLHILGVHLFLRSEINSFNQKIAV